MTTCSLHVLNGPKIIKLFLRLFFLAFLVLSFSSGAQAQSRKAERAQKKYDRLVEKEKKDYEKRRKETIKHRYEIQSPEVRERMKATEKRSRKYGRKQKEPFFKRIFKGKKKPGRKKARRKR